jgi:hypothetical protein
MTEAGRTPSAFTEVGRQGVVTAKELDRIKKENEELVTRMQALTIRELYEELASRRRTERSLPSAGAPTVLGPSVASDPVATLWQTMVGTHSPTSRGGSGAVPRGSASSAANSAPSASVEASDGSLYAPAVPGRRNDAEKARLRRKMYDRQVDERGNFKAGACARFRTDAFVSDAEEDVKGVHVVQLAPGLVMMDTGCRAAVGGASWHHQLQKILKKLGKKFYSEDQLEFFQFGPGEPIQSTRRWHYAVGVLGRNRVLRISEVPVECPGLIGPTELSAWQMLLNFQDKTFTSEARTTSIIYARSGHPYMRLLDYEGAPEKVYQVMHVEEESNKELDEEEPPSDPYSSDTELEGLLRWTSAKAEDLDADLPELVRPSSEDESPHAWTSEEKQSDGETEEDEIEEHGFFTAGAQEADGKYMSKSSYRHVWPAIRTIWEGMTAQKEKKIHKEAIPVEKTLATTPVGPRRTGPWRLVEIFAWTSMVTAMAYELIPLPGWDVSMPDVRGRARKRLVKMDPDYVVWAPPGGPWSQDQMLNQRKPQQEVVQFQVRRGRAGVLEDPRSSLLWRQTPILSAMALPGVAAEAADMWAYNKQRPDTQELAKKSTAFKGSAAVCKELEATCDGHHEHGPVMGGWTKRFVVRNPSGKKIGVSEWAGGYIEVLAKKLLDGTLKQFDSRRRAAVIFPVDGGAEGPAQEESFIYAEDVVEDHWSSNELRLNGAIPVDMDYTKARVCPVCAVSASHTVFSHERHASMLERLECVERFLRDSADKHASYLSGLKAVQASVPERLDYLEKAVGDSANVIFPVGKAEEGDGPEGSRDESLSGTEDDWSSRELPEAARAERYRWTLKAVRGMICESHRGIGHPSRATLLTMPCLGGATPAVREVGVRTRPSGFHKVVRLDRKYVRDGAARNLGPLLLLTVEAGISWHAARILKDGTPLPVAKGLLALAPDMLVGDQGGELEGVCNGMCGEYGSGTCVVGAHVPWRHGFGGRHGGFRVVVQFGIEHRESVNAVLNGCVQKDSTLTRDILTPDQAVLGLALRWPAVAGIADNKGIPLASRGTEGEAWLADQIRAAAHIALPSRDALDKVRETALQRALAVIGELSPGMRVCLWSPHPTKGCWRRNALRRRGLAMVIARVGWRSCAFLSAQDQLHLVTTEEAAAYEIVGKDMVLTHDLRTYQGRTRAPSPPVRRPPVQPQPLVVLVAPMRPLHDMPRAVRTLQDALSANEGKDQARKEELERVLSDLEHKEPEQVAVALPPPALPELQPPVLALMDESPEVGRLPAQKRGMLRDEVSQSLKKSKVGATQVPHLVMFLARREQEDSWLRRGEADGLGSLTGYKVTGACVHSQLRRRTSEQNRLRHIRRFTLMGTQEDEGAAAWDEGPGAAQESRKMPGSRTGLTIFYEEWPRYEVLMQGRCVDTPVGLVETAFAQTEAEDVQDICETWGDLVAEKAPDDEEALRRVFAFKGKNIMKELCCAKAVFILRDEEETVAMPTLHEDDGLFAGDGHRQRYQRAVKDINSKFKIKGWHDLKTGAVNCLGRRWKLADRGVTLDLDEYIGNLTDMELKEPIQEDMKLGDGAVPMFRSTLAQVHWPVSHVVPKLAYVVSSLAQVGPTALTWKQVSQLNLVVVTLMKMVQAGQARVVLPRLRGSPVTIVTPVDASYAQEPGLKSQAGFVSFLTTGDITKGEVPCALVEFQSTTILRVMKSTLASEFASLSTALDRQLYLRLLVQSLLQGEPTYTPDWRHRHTTQGIMVKSLYDHLNMTGKIPKGRQTMIDPLVAQDLIEAYAVRLGWVPMWHMLADILTKMMAPGEVFRMFRDKQIYSLIRNDEEQEEEQRRLGLRQGQRQRRKARVKGMTEADGA